MPTPAGVLRLIGVAPLIRLDCGDGRGDADVRSITPLLPLAPVGTGGEREEKVYISLVARGVEGAAGWGLRRRLLLGEEGVGPLTCGFCWPAKRD